MLSRTGKEAVVAILGVIEDNGDLKVPARRVSAADARHPPDIR
jgi:hypothetical protein